MFCPNCGSAIEDGLKFCPNCGASLIEAAPAQQQGGYQQQEEAQQQGGYQQQEEVQQQGGYQQQEEVQQQAGYQEPQQTAYPDQGYQHSGQGGYQQNTNQGGSYGYAPMSGGTVRNIALSIVFSIISCGIYAIYWMYKLNEEINALVGDENATSGGMVILLSLVTCGIYGFYWYYKMGEKVDHIKEQMGVSSANSNIIFLILGICGLGVVNFGMMQDTINKAMGG